MFLFFLILAAWSEPRPLWCPPPARGPYREPPKPRVWKVEWG